MDLKTLLATLTVLGSGATLVACGGEAEKKDTGDKDAKEVPHAKPEANAKADGDKGDKGDKAGAEGEMSCAPGQCGEGKCGNAKDAKGEGDKALADEAKKDEAPAEAAPEGEAKQDPETPAT